MISSRQAGPRSLAALFVFWKTLLLLIAGASPGPGYDTSASLLFEPDRQSTAGHVALKRSTSAFQLPAVGRLVRWDAVYFVESIQRGYRYEQEWAFGRGFPKTVAVIASSLERVLHDRWTGDALALEIYVAVILANLFHFLSVFTLYRLSYVVFSGQKGKNIAFVAASLHVFSPAGIFLSAPYAESLFSCLSFLGYLFYAESLWSHERRRPLRRDSLVLAAGLTFGLSTAVRSNGLFNGALFLYDFSTTSASLVKDGFDASAMRRWLVLGFAGVLVSLGMIIPQAFAYEEYCRVASIPRPWCSNFVPSIYAWVQDHYWNVGFLRYWTLSNLPLFIIASPMLAVLGRSSAWALEMDVWMNNTKAAVHSQVKARHGSETMTQQTPVGTHADLARRFLPRVVLPQLILTALAISSYHVQIINRISSGYVVWYWWLACAIVDQQKIRSRLSVAEVTVRWITLYSLVQAALFASFLPPA